VRELAHAQVGDADEGCRVLEAAGGTLGLLQQAVHGFDEGVAAVLEHASHNRIEVARQRGTQPFERVQSAAPRPDDPAPKVTGGRGRIAVQPGLRVDLAQPHLQPPGPRALEVGALQPMHGLALRGAPARGVAPHGPQHRAALTRAQRPELFLHPRSFVLPFGAAHFVHGFIGQGYHVVTVVADLRLRQRRGHPQRVGRTHVHAHVLDLLDLAAVRHQVLGEALDGAVLAPRRGKQQPLGIQVVHHGDVLLAAAHAGLVHAHGAHLAHVLAGAGLPDVVLDAPPQLLVGHPQHLRGLAHRQILAQREGQRLEQHRETAALTRPGHRNLAGLAACRAANARDRRVQPGLELEEVQMPPGSAYPFVYRLVLRAAGRACHARACVDHLEVDAPLGRVQFHLVHLPRIGQAQRCREQAFNFQSRHFASLRYTTTPERTAPAEWFGGCEVKFHGK